MFLTGAMLCLSALTYSVVVQNDPPFMVHFPDAVLKPTFNYSFYLTVVTGGLTILASFVIFVMDLNYPRKVATFFHHAVISDDAIFEVGLYVLSLALGPWPNSLSPSPSPWPNSLIVPALAPGPIALVPALAPGPIALVPALAPGPIALVPALASYPVSLCGEPGSS